MKPPKKRRVLSAKEKHRRKMLTGDGLVLHLWEELRNRNTKPQRRLELINQIMQSQSGRLLAGALRPSFSRVFQSCVKHGLAAHHKALAVALQNKLVELAHYPHSYQLVLALLKYHKDAEVKAILLDALVKGADQLAVSKCGVLVLEWCYSKASVTEKRRWVARMLGLQLPEVAQWSRNFQLDLEQTWEAHPQLQQACMQKLQFLAGRLVSRGLINHSCTQKIVELQLRHGWHFYSVEIIQELKGSLIHILHTESGSGAAIQCLRLADEDTRKAIVESFRGHVAEMCRGRHSCWVICATLDLVDTAKVVREVVLAELRCSLGALLVHPCGVAVLLHLVTPEWARKRLRLHGSGCADLYHLGKEAVMPVMTEGVRRTTEAPREVILWRTDPYRKHAMALQALLPTMKQLLLAEPARYFSSSETRPFLAELERFAASKHPGEMGVADLLDEDFVSQLKSLSESIAVVYRDTGPTTEVKRGPSSFTSKKAPIKPFPRPSRLAGADERIIEERETESVSDSNGDKQDSEEPPQPGNGSRRFKKVKKRSAPKSSSLPKKSAR
eukprot:RCo030937